MNLAQRATMTAAGRAARWMRAGARSLTAGLGIALLASCGGGESPRDASITPASPATAPDPRRTVLSIGAAADPAHAEHTARRLLDLAERMYPHYFPDRPATLQAGGFWYRHHPRTDMYVGVRDGVVFVLGGPFGEAPVEVGPVSAFLAVAPPPAAPCAATAGAWEAWQTPEPRLGQTVSLLVAGCTGPLDRLAWRQSAGPAVPLLADRTQVVSFDPPAPGLYRFEADFTDPAGAARTQAFELQVPDLAPAPARLAVRAGHAVRAGGKVSLRAWPETADEASAATAVVAWTQVDGPPVTLDSTEGRLVTFTAPEVPRDTLLRLRATMTLPDGRSGEDEVVVLVERHAQAQASDWGALWSGDHVPRVHPFRRQGPHAAALVRCVYDSRQRTTGVGSFAPCPLRTLPFLAQETQGGVPTVEQVMDRVVVSHDWLGQRFEAFLRTHDADGQLRRMMNSVTAIVLGTQVRPSFYWAATGAIYLDGDNFWVTPEERDTVNEVPDYRGEFSNALAYRALWRYVRDGAPVLRFYDPEQRLGRTLDDVRDDAVALLYHELGHALDFLPPADWPFLVASQSAWSNLAGRYARETLPSDEVSRQFPLTSTVMFGLAQVRFRGLTATEWQRTFSPLDVAAAFAADRATDDYSYSSSREDAAMTLEEALMNHLQGARRDVAMVDPYPRAATGADIVVRWGQRGRIGEPAIRPRARLLLHQMTPWIRSDLADLLPPPQALREGVSWRENLADPSAPADARRGALRAGAAEDPALAQRRLAHALRRMAHARHEGAPPQPGTAAWAARYRGVMLDGVEGMPRAPGR